MFQTVTLLALEEKVGMAVVMLLYIEYIAVCDLLLGIYTVRNKKISETPSARLKGRTV